MEISTLVPIQGTRKYYRLETLDAPRRCAPIVQRGSQARGMGKGQLEEQQRAASHQLLNCCEEEGSTLLACSSSPTFF